MGCEICVWLCVLCMAVNGLYVDAWQRCVACVWDVCGLDWGVGGTWCRCLDGMWVVRGQGVGVRQRTAKAQSTHRPHTGHIQSRHRTHSPRTATQSISHTQSEHRPPSPRTDHTLSTQVHSPLKAVRAVWEGAGSPHTTHDSPHTQAIHAHTVRTPHTNSPQIVHAHQHTVRAQSRTAHTESHRVHAWVLRGLCVAVKGLCGCHPRTAHTVLNRLPSSHTVYVTQTTQSTQS